MNTIITSGNFITSTTDTPINARSRINSITDIPTIENPAVGEFFYCIDTQKVYVITGLKQKIVSGVAIPNAQIDTYSELGNSQDVAESIARKQDLLVNEQNIRSINGMSLLGSGTIIVPQEGQDISNLTILDSIVTPDSEYAVKSSGIYSAIVDMIQTAFGDRLKVLSKQQYDAITEKNPNTIYFIYELED